MRTPFVWLVLLLCSCKVPVEDQLPESPPPAPSRAHKPTRALGVNVRRGMPPVRARQYVLNQEPPIRYKVRARFGDAIALLGYDVPKRTYRPGEVVSITLYFKVLQDPRVSWKVFMHLDPTGVDDPRRRGYGDHYPVGGMYPTNKWKKGQIIRDEMRVPLHRNVGTRTADLWMGLYTGGTRARLSTQAANDGKGRLKLAVFQVGPGGSSAPPAPSRKRYRVHRTTGKIKIDGQLDESDWQRVRSTGRFTRTVGGTTARMDTWAKLLWDDEFLYVAFYCADRDIRSPFKKRDDPLWRADAVEVFIDADGDGKTYVELQVSPANQIFDAYFPLRGPPNKRGGDLSYTANIRSAVRLDGTLNNSGDQDRSWTVEMAIPLKDIKAAPRVPPRKGDVWRAHLIRVERSRGMDDSAWSPPGGDYHNLSAMGELVFAGPAGKRPPRLRLDPKTLRFMPSDKRNRLILRKLKMLKRRKPQ